METLKFNRATFQLFERLVDNVGRLADEVERLNENLEEQ